MGWDSWMGACHGRYPRHAPIQESQCNSMGCPWRPPHELAMEDIEGMHPSKNPGAIPWDAHGDLHMSLPWKISKACAHPRIPAPMLTFPSAHVDLSQPSC